MTEKRNLPPILIHRNYQGDMTRINNSFREQYKRLSYTCVLVKGGTEVRTSCNKDYKNLTKFLEENNVPFHLMREDTQTLSVVIRGIPSDIKPDTINEALQAKGFNALSIKNMLSPSGVPYPMFAVELQKDPNSQNIFKLSGLCYYTVVVEGFRSRDQLIQCRNCQRFQHTIEMCRALPRCRICADSHNARECRLSLGIPPCCINCNGEHTADSSVCPVRKAVMKTIRNKNQPTQQPSRNHVQNEYIQPRPQSARGNTQTITHVNRQKHS